MGFVINSDVEKSKNYARNVRRAITVIYIGGVLFAEVMFIWFLEKAFDSQIVGLFALFGALLVGISGIVFLFAKQYWFADGIHEKLGYTFWAIDITMLALNTLVAFQAAGKLDTSAMPIVGEIVGIWRSLSPATPIIVIAMWAVLVAVSPEMEHSRSVNKSMARLLKFHSEQLEQEAMNSPEAKQIIAQAARELTIRNARALTGDKSVNLAITAPAMTQLNSDGMPLLANGESSRENGNGPKR